MAARAAGAREAASGPSPARRVATRLTDAPPAAARPPIARAAAADVAPLRSALFDTVIASSPTQSAPASGSVSDAAFARPAFADAVDARAAGQGPRAPTQDIVAAVDDRPVVEGPLVSPQTIASRALTVMVAIMTFLCAALLGCSILVERAADAWSIDVLDEISVTVLPLDGDPVEPRLDRVAAILGGADGLTDVAVVPAAESEALLEPWLGQAIDLSLLPTPRLVTARRSGTVDPTAIGAALQEIPGAVLDDHAAWSERLSDLASAAAGGAIVALGLMLVATAISIVFATRSTIATNAATVEVLNALGADDRFVAQAFRRRFFLIGLRGAAIGIAVALGLFGGLDLWSAVSVGARSAQSRALFGDPSIGVVGYLLLLSIAAAVVVLVTITSTVSVRHHLHRLAR